MSAKLMMYAGIAQTAILAATVLVGAMLLGSPSAELRILHRALGMLSLLSGGVTTYLAWARSAPRSLLLLSSLALFSALMAGAAGMSLSTTNHYATGFATMRALGGLAFLLSIGFLVRLRSESKVNTATTK